jgi:hypothetical protein
MNTNPSEIANALLDVRKAYRLLHDYQRAALDAASYIGNRLGFTYEGGYSRFTSCSPRTGKGWLGASAWDWLNLYFYEFHFMKQEEEGKQIFLSILLFSDTGFYLNESVAPDRDDPGTYPSAEQSQTKVGFTFYRHWKGDYDSLFANRQQTRDFLIDEKLPAMLLEGGVRGMVRDFSCLAEQESTDTLVTELIGFGAREGFRLGGVSAAAATAL